MCCFLVLDDTVSLTLAIMIMLQLYIAFEKEISPFILDNNDKKENNERKMGEWASQLKES